MNRKTQITIETHSITIIRTSGALNVCCAVCQKQVSAFASGEIAAALKMSAPELEFMRDAGEIHSVAENNLQLCGDSLAAILRRMNQ